MNEIKRKNWLDISLEAGWLAIIFFVPLFFLREMHNVFEIPKNILFQTLTEILLFIYLVKIVLGGLPGREFLWQRIKYLIPTFIFIVILGVSTVFSQVPWFSFWGSWERRMGYLAWLHFFVFALILILNIKGRKQIFRLFFTVTLCSFFVVVYGMIQALGIEPFEWTFDPFLSKRIFSSVGQPNFLGSWLLLVMPIIFYLFVEKRLQLSSKSAKRKFVFHFFLFILLVLLFWALFATKSRGAWIGLIALVGFLSIVFIWQKNKKLMIIPIFCFIIFVGLVAFLNRSGFNKTSFSYNPFLSRLQTFTDLKAAGNYRLMHWRAALDLIKQRPVLGYGLGTQRFNFPRYYAPEFALYEKPNIYLDYAHNDILDVLLAAGFLGLAGYLFLIISVFYLGLKYIFQKIPSEFTVYSLKLMVLALLAGLFGYLVSLQFSFHIMSTLVYFWLFNILVTVLAGDLGEKGDASSCYICPKSGEGLTPKKSLIILLLLALLAVCWWHFNARLYLSSHYFFQAQNAKFLGDWSKVIEEHQKAIKFSPNDPYFRQEFALTLYQLSNFVSSPVELSSELTPDLKQKITWLDLGIENIEMIPQSKRPIEALIWLPWLESEKAYLTKQESDFIKAEKSYQRAAFFSPQTALIYNKWCDLKIYEGKWSEAIERCEKAISLYPDINHPHLNAEHRQNIVDEMVPVYLNLGEIYRRLNDLKKTIDYYYKSALLIVEVYSPPYPEILKYIYAEMSSFYLATGEPERADFWIKKAQSL